MTGSQNNQIKINDTWLTIANYKEPLKAIPKNEGYGYFGTLLMTPDGEYVMCAVCSQLCRDLGRHVMNSHSDQFETVRDYKGHFGLAFTTALISEGERLERKQRMLDWYATLTPEQMKQRLAAAKRGREARSRFQPKQQLETKNKRGTCPDQLLDKIQKVAEQLGHTPSLRDFVKATGTQRYKHLIFSTFGSWANALKLLNLEQKPLIGGNGVERYSDEYLLESLVNYTLSHQKVPTASDCRAGVLPRWETYKRRFGSFVEARKLSGIEGMFPKPRKTPKRERTEYMKAWRLKRKVGLGITNVRIQKPQ